MRIRLAGSQTIEDYVAIKQKVLEFARESGQGGARVLVDVSRYKAAVFTRIGGADLLRGLEHISKIAIIGADIFNWVVTQFLIILIGIGHKLRTFKNETEALAWLQEKDT